MREFVYIQMVSMCLLMVIYKLLFWSNSIYACVCQHTNGLNVINNGFIHIIFLVTQYICMRLSTYEWFQCAKQWFYTNHYLDHTVHMYVFVYIQMVSIC